MSTTDYLKTLDYEQLKFCRDKCEEMIHSVQEQEKMVAWAVTDGQINYGWFRTGDYPKAVELLAKEATEMWADADKKNPAHRELNISIKGKRLPLSEYNALFSDGQWG